MMIGKTHSGKTTFGDELEDKISESVVIQTDPISTFLQNTFKVNVDPDFEHDGSFKKPALKFKLFSAIFEHILDLGKFTLILSNSNMHQKARTEMITKIRSYEYKVIGVYMNYSEEFLLKRIRETKRDTQYLNLSKSFEEVLTRQRDIFIEPRKEEFGVLFEITSENQIQEVQKNIQDLVTKNLS